MNTLYHEFYSILSSNKSYEKLDNFKFLLIEEYKKKCVNRKKNREFHTIFPDVEVGT